MQRTLISLLVFASLAAAAPVPAQSASASANLSIGVAQSQSITGVSLSNTNFTGGAPSGTVIGTINVTMSPAAPAFSGTLSLAGADAAKFQIAGTNLETSGAVAAGTYQVSLVAIQSGASGSPFTQAEALTGTSPVASCPKGTAYADGCLDAPAGTPQHPNLFAGYAVRPPWNVAGVDYYVGVPSGTVLQDPSTPGALPAGVSISGPNIIVSSSNVTLSGFDFSLHGSYGIYIESGVTGTNITHNNFLCSSNTIAVNIGSGASNTLIAFNTIDGGGANGDASFGELIYNQGTTLTVQHNWVKNAPQHFVTVGGGGTLSYKYNLLENGAWYSGAHLNYLQFGGGAYTSPAVDFNTMAQAVTVSGGEGFQMYTNNSGSISGGEIGNNTLIAIPSGNTLAESYIIHAGSNSQYPSPATGTVHDNYIDATGAYGPFYPGLSGFTYSNNVNLVSGAGF